MFLKLMVVLIGIVAAHEVTSKLTQLTKHVAPENVVDQGVLRRAMNVDVDALKQVAAKHGKLEAFRAESQSAEPSQATNENVCNIDHSQTEAATGSSDVNTNAAVLSIPDMEVRSDATTQDTSRGTVGASAVTSAAPSAGDLDETAAAVAGIL